MIGYVALWSLILDRGVDAAVVRSALKRFPVFVVVESLQVRQLAGAVSRFMCDPSAGGSCGECSTYMVTQDAADEIIECDATAEARPEMTPWEEMLGRRRFVAHEWPPTPRPDLPG